VQKGDRNDIRDILASCVCVCRLWWRVEMRGDEEEIKEARGEEDEISGEK